MEAKVRELTKGRRTNSTTSWPSRRLRRDRRIEESSGRESVQRVARIESGEQVVVGVNRFTETDESPLASDSAIETIMTVDRPSSVS